MSREQFTISTDQTRLDIDVIHGFLTKAYWSEGIHKDTVVKSIKHSLCFGAYTKTGEQVGFARVITDRATFSYLADVFVLEAFRGNGVSRLIMEAYDAHPDLKGIRRHILATSDAHGLYEKFGFVSIPDPQIFMQKHNPNVYKED